MSEDDLRAALQEARERVKDWQEENEQLVEQVARWQHGVTELEKRVERLEMALKEIIKMAQESSKGARGRGEDHSLNQFRAIRQRALLAAAESAVLGRSH